MGAAVSDISQVIEDVDAGGASGEQTEGGGPPQGRISLAAAVGDAHPDKTQLEEVKQSLNFIVTAVDAKLDQYQSELELAFANPGSIVKKQVPGIRAMRWSREYHVDVSSAHSDKIYEAIDNFIGDDGSTADILEGFKVVVASRLNSFLAHADLGETEDHRFFVFMQFNALIRIDVKMWRYNFSSKDILISRQNVLGTLLCLSIVDHNKLEMDELVFLLSEYAGGNTAIVEKYVDQLASLWNKVRKLSPKDGG